MVDYQEVQTALLAAEKFATTRNYVGPDPYDGLSSPLAALLPGRIPRQAWVQLIKRSNVKAREVLGVRPLRMAKATALFAEGYWLIGRQAEAKALGDYLLASQNGGPWGYEFDVQTRWAYYKAGTPNVIATAFVVRALARQGRLHEVNPQTLEWLYSLIDPRGYFHYTNASNALIHNGNLLAAETVAQLGGDLRTVDKAVGITLSHQNADGSWPYGEGGNLSWVDNFHTVYVLESLKKLQQLEIESEEALSRGVRYWEEKLFTEKSLPLYFATDTTASTDVHNIATIVGGLSTLGIGQSQPAIDHPAVKLLLDHQGSDGGFRDRENSVPFMRWNQAHAFSALSKLVATSDKV
ncbi:hypothetical protein J2X01_002474 [Arthrobacter ginsengisoli]|uniref:Squalene cyclase C-terminal domain-containing protein n=1 Tax=Arthrobacter ginsengisoli TaxID=1356565 RepID=A0ABU1UDC5_9MICC|nr:terpene cyclase/mutase family protein [Arthrobacter ginsengisoli]MDR7083181.1 hypothetical protein [Arthrobacter ginsengisoli]